jgi:hypothetical protein
VPDFDAIGERERPEHIGPLAALLEREGDYELDARAPDVADQVVDVADPLEPTAHSGT